MLEKTLSETEVIEAEAMKLLNFVAISVLLSSVLCRPTPTVKYVGLRQLGKFSGVNDEGTAYEKTYYVSSYLQMTPPAARSFCKSFGVNMDLVSFESRNEFLVGKAKFEPEVRDKSIFVIVGGFGHASANGKNYYHWISSGLKQFSELEAPNDKMCLGIQKVGSDPVAFIPISCNESLKFICQDMDIQYAN